MPEATGSYEVTSTKDVPRRLRHHCWRRVGADAIDAGWKANHPAAAPLVSFSVDDDAMQLWLSDRSGAARSYASRYLSSHSAPANRDGDAKAPTTPQSPRPG